MGLVKKIDSGIGSAIRNERVQTRPGASPGAWVIWLLPIAVILTAITVPTSAIYRLCAIFSVNLLLNNVLLLCHVKYEGTLSVTRSFNVKSLLPIVISTALHVYNDNDLYRGFCHSISNTLLYLECLPYLLKVFPKSFTFGEACIVSQGLALFVYGTFVRFNHLVVTGPPTGDDEIATTILQVTLLVVLVVCLIPKKWSPSKQYLAAILLLASLIPILNFLLAFNAIYWFTDFIFTGSRLRVICGWAACSGLAWGSVVLQIRTRRKATTSTRKIFHFLAVAVFLSGILLEPLLLYLAAGLVFPLFLLIEFIRIRKLPPLASALQEGFHVYADEKDAGGLALTPIYLLVGCSAPLWLVPFLRGVSTKLPLLAGVLSIGIGDSCASIVGKNFGKQKWSGTNKTVEGSIACAIGQLSLLLALSSLGYLPVPNNVFRLIKPFLAVSVASLVEAKTDQVDNLVLPLVTYILLII